MELPNPLDASTRRYISLAVSSAMRSSSGDLAGAFPTSRTGSKASTRKRQEGHEKRDMPMCLLPAQVARSSGWYSRQSVGVRG